MTPKIYPQNLHTPQNIQFSGKKNIKMQTFEPPQNSPRLRMYEFIRVSPPHHPPWWLVDKRTHGPKFFSIWNWNFKHLFFFGVVVFIQISSEQQRRTWSDATLVMWRLIWVCTVCQCPTKGWQGVNELKITSRVLEITSRNFRKRKTLECNL